MINNLQTEIYGEPGHRGIAVNHFGHLHKLIPCEGLTDEEVAVKAAEAIEHMLARH